MTDTQIDPQIDVDAETLALSPAEVSRGCEVLSCREVDRIDWPPGALGIYAARVLARDPRRGGRTHTVARVILGVLSPHRRPLAVRIRGEHVERVIAALEVARREVGA